MDVFAMVTIIAVATILGKVYIARLGTKTELGKQASDNQELIKRIDSLEKRMNSIEELTLEREKEKRFEDISR